MQPEWRGEAAAASLILRNTVHSESESESCAAPDGWSHRVCHRSRPQYARACVASRRLSVSPAVWPDLLLTATCVRSPPPSTLTVLPYLLLANGISLHFGTTRPHRFTDT